MKWLIGGIISALIFSASFIHSTTEGIKSAVKKHQERITMVEKALEN